MDDIAGDGGPRSSRTTFESRLRRASWFARDGGLVDSLPDDGRFGGAGGKLRPSELAGP